MIGAFAIVPDESALPNVVSKAVIALDTNVLACPYRLAPDLAEEYLQHLESLKGQYFIPFRAVFEFERRRGTLVQEQHQVIETLVNKVRNELRAAARTVHKQHPYFPRREAEKYLENLGNQLQTDINDLRMQYAPAGKTLRDAIEQDPIARRLGQIFDGQIAPSYTFNEDVLEWCRSRRDCGLPPGLADSGKGEPDCYGDAMIWREVLDRAEAAATEGTPVVLVTGDFKEDWWHFEGKWRRSPRFELIQEMADRGVSTFAMLSARELLQHAGCVLSASLENALKAVER